MFVSPFLFPPLYLPIFPLSSSPLLSLSGSILSHIFMITGSRVGGLADAHLHLYRHIMSPTDHRPFQYLANYLTVGSRVSAIELLCPVFRHIHLAPKTSVIYNSAPDSSNSQASLYPGSQKFQTIYRSLPSPPHSRPSQCIFIMLLLVTTHHRGSKRLALINEQ
jgi:hypothetical protein